MQCQLRVLMTLDTTALKKASASSEDFPVGEISSRNSQTQIVHSADRFRGSA